MQPDCRDIKPVYEQITDGIRKMIITHAIPEGEKLPSVRELASKFAINPNAVRKAYQELEEEGYVCDREGGIGKADCGTDPQRAAAGVRHGGNQTAEYVGRDRGIDRTYVGTGRRKQRL